MTSSRFCYVLMCHADPGGILRVVGRIRELSPDAAIVVRVQEPVGRAHLPQHVPRLPRALGQRPSPRCSHSDP